VTPRSGVTDQVMVYIERAVPRIKSAQIIAKALIDARLQQKGGSMAGGKFFALIDEMAASEQRLDALAEPLLEKMAESEKLAARAVESKSAKIDAAIDYIKRMDEVSESLGDNGGPKLPEDSKESPQSSDSEAK
jgi:hypothetical protein